MLGQVIEVLGQSQADALCQAAVEVAVNQQLVHDGTHVSNAGELLNGNLTGLGIDADLGQEQGVHIGCEGLALRGSLINGVSCAVVADPVAQNLGLNAFSLHFVVGTVGAVFLLHCSNQVFCCQTASVTGHNLAAGTACGAGVGSVLGVVHNELDLLGLDACLAQSLVSGHQNAHISALAVIFPRSVHSDGAVGIQLSVSLGCVNAVQTAAVNTGSNTDTVLVAAIGGSVLLSNASPTCLVQRTSHLVHFFQTVDIGRVAGGDGGLFRFLVAVQLADIEGIHAHLGGQNVDGDFRAHEGLGRTVSTECRAPGVVGEDGLGLVADGGDVVACANELAQTVSQQIAELGVRTVVDVVVAPQTQQLAVFVGSQLDVHEAGGTLAGVGDVLELVEDQGHGLADNLGSCAQDGFVGGGELVAEGAAGVVLNDSQLVHGNADAVSDHGHMQVDTDGLGVDSDHAVFVDVCVAAVGL